MRSKLSESQPFENIYQTQLLRHSQETPFHLCKDHTKLMTIDICTLLILLHVMFYEYTPAFDFNVILCNFLMLKVTQLSLYKT